jgi:cytoskeletal protein RodZ
MIEHEPDPLRRIPVKHADVHAEVGAVLRAARLKRGLSLENVAEQTRIPKRYIDALENDRLDEFPAFVYMRGFMKSYCDHLDLPFDDIWARVQSTAPAAAAQAPAPTAPVKPPSQPAPAPARAAASPAPAPLHSPVPHAAPAAESSSSAAGAVVLALGLGIGLTVWILRNQAAAPPPKPAESTPRALLPVSKPVETRVVVRAVDDCWARVTVDGNSVFEGRIPRGAAMDWTPTKSLTLRATVPAALQVTVNGAPYPLGAPPPDGDYRIDVP